MDTTTGSKKGKQLNVTLDPDLVDWIKDKAEREGRTVKGLIRLMLEEARRQELAA